MLKRIEGAKDEYKNFKKRTYSSLNQENARARQESQKRMRLEDLLDTSTPCNLDFASLTTFDSIKDKTDAKAQTHTTLTTLPIATKIHEGSIIIATAKNIYYHHIQSKSHEIFTSLQRDNYAHLDHQGDVIAVTRAEGVEIYKLERGKCQLFTKLSFDDQIRVIKISDEWLVKGDCKGIVFLSDRAAFQQKYSFTCSSNYTITALDLEENILITGSTERVVKYGISITHRTQPSQGYIL